MKKIKNMLSSPKSHWVGDGFPAKTLFSYDGQASLISPFLLLDYAGPMKFTPTKNKRGVGEHPHRGFETITIVYEGELAHKDSTGEQGLIGAGDIQWMTAGAGILHEEFHSDEFSREGGMLDMMQLWVNLPKSHKMTTPKYQTILASQVPIITIPEDRGHLRVIAGECEGQKGPADTHTSMLVMDGLIKASGKYYLPIPDGWSAIVIVRKGHSSINQQPLSIGQTIILSTNGVGLEIEAHEDSELLILSGEPIDEPLVGYGPFVMNTQEEIKQAITDFQTGKFGMLEH